MFIQWNDDFKIGSEIIDAEHKSIIDEFEKLYSYMKDGSGHDYYNEFYKFLDEYVNTHLEHEELYQKEIDYPLCKKHKALHDVFRKKIISLKESTEGRDITNKDLIDISIFVRNWFVNHILVEDKKLGEYIQELEK